eukprot:Em0012g686a
MRSLVLKHDIATMYKVYSEKYKDARPGKPPIGSMLYYLIAKTITGGGKKQEARAGVDYIKVNFHTDNFAVVDKILMCLLRSQMWTTSCVMSCMAFALICTPSSVMAIQVFVDQVRNQLSLCALARGTVASESNIATTHSSVFSLDLAPQRKPNKTPKTGDCLECSACRSAFLFYDRLRQVFMMIVDEDPTRLAEDFREGGDSYYSKKRMLWWGAGVYVKDRTRLHNLNKEKGNEEDVMVKELTAKSTEVEEGSMEWEMHACGAEEDADLEVLGKGLDFEEKDFGEQEEESDVELEEDIDEEDREDEVMEEEDWVEGEAVGGKGEDASDKIIVQSDNAKTLAGKQTKQFLPHVCSAARLKLVAYYHNEAQSRKDVCDTHFSHQKTQVEAYIAQGDGGRKISTPKQLAVALVNTSVRNTAGIPTFYASQYVTVAGEQQIRMFDGVGQK